MGRRTRRLAVGGRTLAGAVLVLAFASTGLLGAQAAPVETSTAVSRLAGSAPAARATPNRAQDRATLAREAEEADEEVYLSVESSCASSARRSAKPSAVLFSMRKATFDWVLTSGSGLRKTGMVTIRRDAVAELKLPSLRTGTYRITLTERGASAPLSDQTFDVRLCLQVKKTCHAVRFTNPASNPAADLTYGAGEESTFDVRLAPGEARTVRVDDKKIRYSAWAVTQDEAVEADDEVPTATNLGRGTLKVKQSCRAKAATPTQNAVQTSAVVGCATPGTPAPVTFGWVAQKSLKNRMWAVVDPSGAVAARGSFTRGREKTVRLPAGAYTYRSHANKKADPFEEIAFTVLECVEVTATCRAVDVANPNGVEVGVVVVDPALFDEPDLDLGDDPDSDQLQELTLAAGADERVAWTRREAVVLAFADPEPAGRFENLASPFPADEDDVDALPRVVVPQDC